jgi:tetratricopeptide (TPR) repeat protein
MQRAIKLILLLVLLNGSLAGQVFDFNKNCIEAYQRILSLQFDAGQAYIRVEKKNNPSNLLPLVLENYIEFLTVFISEERPSFRLFAKNKKARTEQLTAGDSESPYYRWSLAMINMQGAVARLKFGEYMTAVFEMRRAFLLFEENSKLFPEFEPNNAGMGLLYALVGSVPPKYYWGVRLASMHGSIHQGREMLYAVVENSTGREDEKHLRDESLFFLSFIETNLMPDNSGAERLLNHFDVADESNLLLSYAWSNMLMRLGRNDEAIIRLRSRSQSEAYFPFHYLDYLLADAYLRKLETDSAAFYFQQFLTHFKGINYKADAKRKMAWAALLDGDQNGYKERIGLVLQTDVGQIDADNQAHREALGGNTPNKVLLKSRLLFDGGYYDKAIALLTDYKGNFDKGEHLEKTYRLGRIYHEMGNLTDAIMQYQKAIEAGKNNNAYYAANACLKLGAIYEQLGKNDEAFQAYYLCLNLKPDEYRNSIHQKAQAGINRLSEHK